MNNLALKKDSESGPGSSPPGELRGELRAPGSEELDETAELITNMARINLRANRGLSVFGDVVYGPAGTCGPRIQHDFQLVVIHKGSLELMLDGEEVRVSAGHAVLLSPQHQEYFIFARDRETHHSWCAIHPSAIPQVIRDEFGTSIGPVPFAGRLVTLFDLARTPHQWMESNAVQDVLYESLALAIMCEFVSLAGGHSKPANAAEQILAKMNDVILKRFAEPLSLKDIARAAGVSKQHLLKACRSEGKPSPIRQLYSFRLQTAADLLRETGLNLGAVADDCGFANVFHFSRKFKQTYGLSPLAWRKQQWHLREGQDGEGRKRAAPDGEGGRGQAKGLTMIHR